MVVRNGLALREKLDATHNRILEAHATADMSPLARDVLVDPRLGGIARAPHEKHWLVKSVADRPGHRTVLEHPRVDRRAGRTGYPLPAPMQFNRIARVEGQRIAVGAYDERRRVIDPNRIAIEAKGRHSVGSDGDAASAVDARRKLTPGVARGELPHMQPRVVRPTRARRFESHRARVQRPPVRQEPPRSFEVLVSRLPHVVPELGGLVFDGVVELLVAVDEHPAVLLGEVSGASRAIEGKVLAVFSPKDV